MRSKIYNFFIVIIFGGVLSLNSDSVFDEELYESVLDSRECSLQLNFLTINSLGLSFLDASAKVPSGVSKGNLNDFGDYFQCLDINTMRSRMAFQGKYCVIQVPMNQNPFERPKLPSLPEWPKLPDRPQWPGLPDLPQWPAFPDRPQWPGWPSWPQWPIWPDRPQWPELPNWPEGWPESWPPERPEGWPENWPWGWPEERPENWPENWPWVSPGNWPDNFPADWLENWPVQRPEGWPENWPWGWPETWPDNWPIERPENWPENWPWGWPEGLPNFPWPWLNNSQQNPEQRIFPAAITAQNMIVLAMCIPKVCSVEQTINFIERRVRFMNLTYEPYYCRLPNDKPLAAADFTAIAIFSTIGVLLLISTFYDIHQRFILNQDSSSIDTLYSSFSVYTNIRRILTFNTSAGTLDCIDGIRALSMFWVVIGHTYSLSMLGFIHNLSYTINWMQKFSSVWITSGPIVVDTFFLISGILAVYTTIGKISRGRFVRTVHMFILNRILRMFPLLAAVVLLQASLFHHVSDGPYWMNVAHATENCRRYWWSALLHVQNYVNPLEICLPHSWYISVDMQLYVASPIVLFFLFGREWIAWCVLTAVLLLSLVSTSLVSFMYNFSAALGNMSRLFEFPDYVQYYYINTLTRAPPFVIGMIYGYKLYLYRNEKIKIPKNYVTTLWLLSFGLMAFCIFSMYPVIQSDHDGQILDNLLNAYMRTLWAIALGWLIFACVQGYGGIINWFLSLHMWKLPARLSYAIYLIHLPLIVVANGTWVKTYYYSDGSNIYRFFGDICFSFIAAFILSIAIDAPCSTLQKLLTGPGKKRPKKPTIESPASNSNHTTESLSSRNIVQENKTIL